MPIVKHIPIHSFPKAFLEYILDSKKNGDMKFVTGINSPEDEKQAYKIFERTFEQFSGERFYRKMLSEEDKGKKEKVRLHHYIQSFSPEENITPEEAHQIGVEWAKKAFGENRQILVTTHVNKSHIHNHIAVAPYDFEGKHWISNLTTLKKCRSISDEVAKAHGVSIIENPRHKNTYKYTEWLASQNGESWKDKLREEIDRLVLSEEINCLNDLTKKLSDMGYEVKLNKYMSIKPPKRKAIRSYRLGEDYGTRELKYRIENKDMEMSIEAICIKYKGIGFDYALCLRQLQIFLYREIPNRYNVTYHILRKNADLLNFIDKNKITTVSDFEKTVNAADEKYRECKNKKADILKNIQLTERLIKNAKRYYEIYNADFPTQEEITEMNKLSYIEKEIPSESNISEKEKILERLKADLEKCEKEVEAADRERKTSSDNYKTFLQQTKSDYELIYEEMKAEREKFLHEAEEVYRREQNHNDDERKGTSI